MAVKGNREDQPGGDFNMGQDFLDFVNQGQQPNPQNPPDPLAAAGGQLGQENQGKDRNKDLNPGNGTGTNPNPDSPYRPPPPPTLTPPSPESGNPTSAVTPPPTSPTPAPPVPYNPMPSPSPSDLLGSPMQFDQLGGGSLTGKAGGLLGGGLGTTGNVDDKNDSLLPLLMKLLQSQGQ